MTSNTRRTTCANCGRPIEQASKGRPRTTCSVACRRALYVRRHPEVVVLFLGDVLLDEVAAPGGAERGDAMREAVDLVLEYVQTIVSMAEETGDEDRVHVVRSRLKDATLPLFRRLLRDHEVNEDVLAAICRRLDPVDRETERAWLRSRRAGLAR